MNIDNMNNAKQRFSPQQELEKHRIPRLYRWRTLLIFCSFILCTMLWAFLCRSCINDYPTNHMGFGGGNSNFGSGSGSGKSGDGPGAGKSGNGKGKFDQAQGTAGIGKDASQTGTANPNQGQLAVDGSPQTQTTQILNKIPLHVESIATEVTPPTPAKIVASPYTGGAVQGRTGFYGVSIRKSSRVLFIVDCSGSMGAHSSEMPGKTRMDVMKMELEKAIFSGNSDRRPTGSFGIVSFSHHTKKFPDKSSELAKYTDAQHMKEAKEFIDKLYRGGGTNMKTAWDAAIKIIRKNNVDTVYFMTDGEPGDGFDLKWLKAALKKHRINHLAINCITVGGHGKKLMKDIADEYKGTFVLIP